MQFLAISAKFCNRFISGMLPPSEAVISVWLTTFSLNVFVVGAVNVGKFGVDFRACQAALKKIWKLCEFDLWLVKFQNFLKIKGDLDGSTVTGKISSSNINPWWQLLNRIQIFESTNIYKFCTFISISVSLSPRTVHACACRHKIFFKTWSRLGFLWNDLSYCYKLFIVNTDDSF